jgi:hypothetical protein
MSLVMLDQLDMETIMNEFYTSHHNLHTWNMDLIFRKVLSIHDANNYKVYASAPLPNSKCGFLCARSRIVCAYTEFAHANQLRVYVLA